MRLDASYLHFVSREQIRVLTAIEMGMRNHQYVPPELIARIANLKGGQTFKTIQKLLKNKFIVHIGNKCDGYKLTYLGYDYLALHTFMKRGLIKQVLGKIGVGKQSDVYKCISGEGEEIVLKLTRLGRNSFRSIKKNRQYIQHRTSYSWLYLSRLSSHRQFLFMQLLSKNGFPTPRPIDTNRHAILMSLVEGHTLCHVQRLPRENIKQLFQSAVKTMVSLAEKGLIHGDFNEFNLIVNHEGTKLTMIDFPQCISIKHPNAATYFNRDVECIYKYFNKMGEKCNEEYLRNKQPGDMGQELFNVNYLPIPTLQQIVVKQRLDHQIKKIGHISLEQYNQLQKYRTQQDRMKAQAQSVLDQQQQQEQQNQQEQQQQNQQEQQNDKQQNLENLKNKLDGLQLQIELIQKTQNKQKYDEQLQKMLQQFQQQVKVDQNIQNKQCSDDQSEEQERFKGMTAYEIRMKIKQQKRIQRQKKKEATSTQDYIKKALRKGGRKGQGYRKGNHGNKNRLKQANNQIRDNIY